jgi:hypothetical protein
MLNAISMLSVRGVLASAMLDRLGGVLVTPVHYPAVTSRTTDTSGRIQIDRG